MEDRENKRVPIIESKYGRRAAKVTLETYEQSWERTFP